MNLSVHSSWPRQQKRMVTLYMVINPDRRWKIRNLHWLTTTPLKMRRMSEHNANTTSVEITSGLKTGQLD